MEKLRNNILLILFLLTPFGLISMGVIHIGQIYFICMAALFILAFMIKNKWITLFLSFIAVWQIYSCLTLMFNPKIPTIHVSNGFGMLMFLLVGSIIYLASSKSKIEIEKFYDVICIAACLQAGIAIFQFIGLDPLKIVSLFVPSRSELPARMVTGSCGNPNFLGAFLAISLPFFFRKKWAYLLIPVGLALLLSKSSSAIVPAIVGCGVYYFITKKVSSDKIVGYSILFIIMVFSYILWVSDNMFTNPRWYFWKWAVTQVADSGAVILGLGPGYPWAEKWPLHSEWVFIFHQFGLAGLFLAFAYVVSVFRKLRDPIMIACFAIIAVNLIGNSSLHYAPSGFLICMVLGMIERKQLNV